VSSLVPLACAELAIRKGWVPQPRYIESSGWWRDAWFRGNPGPIPAAFVALDRDLGWLPAANLDRLRLEGARVGTNSANIRGRREYPPGPSERPRIVAVGDSYVFGQCVGDEQTIPARLEALLPGSDAINHGVMGYGHDQMLLRLRLHGLRYEPDVVLLGFHTMDMPRNLLDFRDYAKPRFRLEEGALVLENVPVKMPEELLGRRWPPRLLDYAIMLHDRLREEQRRAYSYGLAFAIVEQIMRETQEAGARFALLYLPRAKDLLRGERFGIEQVERFCAEAAEAICISPVERVVRAIPREDYPRHFQCHYSPQLYGLIADEVAAVLARELPGTFAAGPGASAP